MASGTGVKKDAFKNYGIGQNLSNQLTAQASNIYGGLEPTLQAEAAHPMGFTPQAKAVINTAGQQSAGGSTAGAVGQGRLYATRTKNAGGAKAAIGQGVRSAGENLSNAAVGTEVKNAALQNQQQQAGLHGLQGLYGTELGEGENALGLSNQALNIASNAQPSFWQQLASNAANATLGVGAKAVTSAPWFA